MEVNKELKMPYDNSLLGWHYDRLLQASVAMAGLKGNEKVLDFGCEAQHLKRFLPKKVRYVGYDVVQKFSDVKDYRKLTGIDVVFCMNVLDHLKRGELETLIKDLKRMKVKKIVVGISSNNLLNRVLSFVFGYDAENFFTHFLEPKEIGRALMRNFGLPTNFGRVHLVQYIAVFESGRKGQ